MQDTLILKRKGSIKVTEKVSIIVAAYNEEKNINNCIEALLNQTYSNLEIIVVDDGSTDSTSSIVQSIKDTRIVLRRIENSGVSIARNTGLEIATGKWIAFCDADDYYLPTAIDDLVRVANQLSCDLVQGCYSRSEINADTTSVEKAVLVSSIDAIKVLFNKYTFLGCSDVLWSKRMREAIHGPYGKIIARSLIGESKFETNLKLGEDLLFYYDLLSKTENIGIISEDVYHITVNPNSVTRRFNPEMPEHAIKFIRMALRRLRERSLYDELSYDFSYQVYAHFSVAVSGFYLHKQNKRNNNYEEFKRFASSDVISPYFRNVYKIYRSVHHRALPLVFLLAQRNYVAYYLVMKIRNYL